MRRLVALAVLTAACGPQIPPPDEGSVARAIQRWPGATLGSLTQGRDLYVTRCSGCHTLYAPDRHPPEAWPDLVAKMTSRAHLDGAQQDLITRYLYAAAGAAPRSDSAPHHPPPAPVP